MFGGVEPERRIGGQTAGLCVEPELQNHIGAIIGRLRRLQYVINKTGDVRHEGELVRRISLYGVGAGGRGYPVEVWGPTAPSPARGSVLYAMFS